MILSIKVSDFDGGVQTSKGLQTFFVKFDPFIKGDTSEKGMVTGHQAVNP